MDLEVQADNIYINNMERKNYYLYSDLGRAKKIAFLTHRKVIKVYDRRDNHFLGYTILKGD